MFQLAPLAPADMGAPPAFAPSVALTRRQKAAVVVHLLISGGVDPGMRDLSRDQQRALVRDMASLRFVDKATLASVVAEFAGELDGIGLHVPRDPARMLAMLDGHLSLDVIESMAAELGLDAPPGDGPWGQVARVEPEVLLTLMEGETDEVCAIALSKLPAARASTAMGLMEEDRADRVTAAFARTEDISPEAVARIGVALGRLTTSLPETAFATDSTVRVGAILNASTAALRRRILARLEETDPAFAARVRACIFSFEDIPARIDPRDLPRILRGIDTATLVTALCGRAPDATAAAEFVLSSISKRMAEQLREEIAERGSVPDAAAEEAMSEVVSEIRRMEEAGDLILLTPEE